MLFDMASPNSLKLAHSVLSQTRKFAPSAGSAVSGRQPIGVLFGWVSSKNRFGLRSLVTKSVVSSGEIHLLPLKGCPKRPIPEEQLREREIERQAEAGARSAGDVAGVVKTVQRSVDPIPFWLEVNSPPKFWASYFFVVGWNRM